MNVQLQWMFCGIGFGRLWVRPGKGFLVTPWHSTEAVLGPSPHPHPLPLLPKKNLGRTWSHTVQPPSSPGTCGWLFHLSWLRRLDK